MSEQKTFALPKKERLCSKTLIDQLFLGHSNNKKVWPLRVVYQVVERKGENDPQVEVLMSVSKRYFKRAVKRNLVKRQLREGYRYHKSILTDVLAPHSDAKILLAFIWLSGHVHDSVEVEFAVKDALRKVADSLEFNPAEPKE